MMDVLEALRCCRADDCVNCPLQPEICDELAVEMESVPAELLDRIEEELERKCNSCKKCNNHYDALTKLEVNYEKDTNTF